MGRKSSEKKQRRELQPLLGAITKKDAKQQFPLAYERIEKQQHKAKNFKGGKGGEIVSTSREGYKHPSYTIKPRMVVKGNKWFGALDRKK